MRILRLISVLVLLGLVSGDVNSDQELSRHHHHHHRHGCSTHYDFDYFLFVLRWPASYCRDKQCLDFKDKWLIHGIWPQYSNGSWPQNCCFEKKWKLGELKPIEEELKEKWTNLNPNAQYDSLWEHEWVKHGTCSKSVEKVKGELKYFKTALRIFDSLPVGNWLEKGKILPSPDVPYSVDAIHSAIEKSIGQKKVTLECIPRNNNAAYPLFSQIYVCLDKNTLTPIDCTGSDDPQCGTDSLIFPPRNS